MTTFNMSAFASALAAANTSDINPAPRGLQPMTLVGIGSPTLSAKSQRENQQDPSKPLRYRITLTFQNDDGETAYYYVSADTPTMDPNEDGAVQYTTPVNLRNFLRFMGMKPTDFDVNEITAEVAKAQPRTLDEFQSLFRDEIRDFLATFEGIKVVANVVNGSGNYADRTNVDKWSLVK